MKPFVFLFFILIVPLAYAISPGEKLDLNYHNITDVTFPCILINNTIFISGDAPLGDLECNITYWKEDEVNSGGNGGSSGGSGGSSYHNTVKVTNTSNCTSLFVCAGYGDCIDGLRYSYCTDVNRCKLSYSRQQSCVMPTNQTVEQQNITISPPVEPIDVVIVIPKPEPVSMMPIFIILAVFVVIIIIGAAIFIARTNE